MRLIIEKQNKDNLSQQSNNSTPILSVTNIPNSPITPIIKSQDDKYRNDIYRAKNDTILSPAVDTINTQTILKNSQNNTKAPNSSPNIHISISHGTSINPINSPYKLNTSNKPKNIFNNSNNTTGNSTYSFPNNQHIPTSNKNQELSSVRQNVLYKSNRPKPALDTRNSASRNYFIGQAITNSSILIPPNNFQGKIKNLEKKKSSF